MVIFYLAALDPSRKCGSLCTLKLEREREKTERMHLTEWRTLAKKEIFKKKILSMQFIYSLIQYPLKMDFSNNSRFSCHKKPRICFLVPFIECTFDKTQ